MVNEASCNLNLDLNNIKAIDDSPSADLKRVDMTRLKMYFNAKSGTSMKNMAHMGQMIKYKRLAYYNYGLS